MHSIQARFVLSLFESFFESVSKITQHLATFGNLCAASGVVMLCNEQNRYGPMKFTPSLPARTGPYAAAQQSLALGAGYHRELGWHELAWLLAREDDLVNSPRR